MYIGVSFNLSFRWATPASEQRDTYLILPYSLNTVAIVKVH